MQKLSKVQNYANQKYHVKLPKKPESGQYHVWGKHTNSRLSVKKTKTWSVVKLPKTPKTGQYHVWGKHTKLTFEYKKRPKWSYVKLPKKPESRQYHVWGTHTKLTFEYKKDQSGLMRSYQKGPNQGKMTSCKSCQRYKTMPIKSTTNEAHMQNSRLSIKPKIACLGYPSTLKVWNGQCLRDLVPLYAGGWTPERWVARRPRGVMPSDKAKPSVLMKPNVSSRAVATRDHFDDQMRSEALQINDHWVKS